jgi:rubrerythrin
MTTTKHWTLDDIPWDAFDPALVDADLLKVAKAAALVEFNACDYATYLCNVFAGDSAFEEAARIWADEEIQHGKALGRWAALADPTFDFDRAAERFRSHYKINLETQISRRGSRSGELISRCMVETGTSSYYAALGEAAVEPVLKSVCQHIAADELRHYKLFYTHLKKYLEREDIGTLQRLRIAIGRIAETEDDELACAYFAANADEEAPYEHERYSREYLSRAYSFYRPYHLDRAVAMMFKACGLRPQSLFFRLSQKIAWAAFELRSRRLQRAA